MQFICINAYYKRLIDFQNVSPTIQTKAIEIATTTATREV